MTDSKDTDDTLDRLARLPVTAEKTGFSAEEMIGCAKCGRTNPPTRVDCFYCGKELELTAEQAARIRPAQRRLESHENGYNVVVRGPAPESAIGAAARDLRIDSGFLSRLLSTAVPLPVFRADSERAASVFAAALASHGLESTTVGDAALDPANPPCRLRSVTFDGDSILAVRFNSGETVRIAGADIRLIVVGAIFEKSVEAVEKRRKGESRIVDAAETASDEALFDLYAGDDPTGYRILTRGFDFSCLGDRKSMIAGENLRTLVEELAALAPSAVVSNRYAEVRDLLEHVWESDQRRDSQGIRRQGFGRFEMTNVSTSSNAAQFTKFSRLCRHRL